MVTELYRLASFRQRCDLKNDCLDKSDEHDCNFLRSDPTYVKEIPPRGRDGGPLTINAGVSILSIPNIDTVGSKLTINFFLTLYWSDSRLQFENLNKLSEDNVLSLRYKYKVWSPTLVFTNALGEVVPLAPFPGLLRPDFLSLF